MAVDGTIPDEEVWNLTRMVGSSGPVCRLNDLGSDTKTLPVLNRQFAQMGRPHVEKFVLSLGWQELIKAAAIDQLLIHQNTPLHVSTQIIRPLRVLATCVQAYSGAEPWAMKADDVRIARDIAAGVQRKGKLGELVVSMIKRLFDTKHLCDCGPLHYHIQNDAKRRRKNRGPQMLATLSERKRAEFLPDMRALWELVRIVFTERPKNFIDAIRFAQLRVMILFGLRVGEACNIPLDWKRTKNYVTPTGRPAGDMGGVSSSQMFRYFSEKQQGRNTNSVELTEAVRHIPLIFQEIVTETLDHVAELTAPLRERLRLQCQTDQFLPELPNDALVNVSEMYVRLTGNPEVHSEISSKLLKRYRQQFDPAVLDEIAAEQADTAKFRSQFYVYWWRAAKTEKLTLRDKDGVPLGNDRLSWDQVYVRIDDVESFIRAKRKTKHSDTAPLPLQYGRTMAPNELLFLMPKRALIEGRNDGVCDVTRYFAVGRVTPQDIMLQLSGTENGIFARYGETEEDRAFSLNTHSLRHLITTEMFRLAIADTIITKQFNRRSVAESYEYDHRTLGEQLQAMDLPPAAKQLPEKARNLAALIKMGRAGGPIVDQFKKVQREQGDEEAYLFLAGEADGFHATPYGFCVNSFLVDPCPRHLECFDGCKYLVACLLDRQRVNLEKLRERTLLATKEIEKRPGTVGQANQLKHGERLVENIDRLLAASAGDMPFKDGRDLSERLGHNRGPKIDGIV